MRFDSRGCLMTPIPETALRARQKYIDGEAVKSILAETGFSLDRFYHWLDAFASSEGF